MQTQTAILTRTGQLRLYRRMVNTKEYWLLDIPSQKRVRFLHHPEAALWHARLSPDDRWVAFSSMSLYVFVGNGFGVGGRYPGQLIVRAVEKVETASKDDAAGFEGFEGQAPKLSPHERQ